MLFGFRFATTALGDAISYKVMTGAIPVAGAIPDKMMMKTGRLVPGTAIIDMIELIDGLALEDSGMYCQWDGEVLSW